MSIEKCAQFKRVMTHKPPYRELQWCKETKSDMQCGGWSDGCKNREWFIPARALPVNGTITFDKPQIPPGEDTASFSLLEMQHRSDIIK